MFNIKKIPWCSNQTLSVNREKNRAHFIPYSEDAIIAVQTRDSDRYLNLNGEWDFNWYQSPLEIDENQIDKITYSGTITVPMNWQFAGHGVFHYTDEMYPFPMDPPYVPMMNECGLYHREITVDAEELTSGDWSYYLNFEGVESAFILYVNGENVGFNQGSRMHSEFAVHSYLKPGKNEIVVQVMQYSAATYLEDQDEWWLGGIIRDVYLLKRPKQHIINVNIDTDYDENTQKGMLSVHLSGNAEIPVEIRLCRKEGTDVLVHQGTLAGGEYVFSTEVENIHSWNVEDPYLYQLMVTTYDSQGEVSEKIPFQIGFRNLAIVNGVLLWNGRRILMKGINRHEFNAQTGRAVTYEQTKEELLMIKMAGMNAVRTSHYPNNPFFYELCDQIGLYVVDEADLETHGFEILGDPTRLCEDPEWEHAYMDRIERMVERDRNHVSIVLWSLGNESSYGRNFKAMYDWVKIHEPLRPVHYEGDYKNQSIDVSSTMYSTIGRLAELDTNCAPLRPHILCEFGHAMGNGPGSLKEYFELIERSNRIQGCFVWEFKDHGISRNIASKEEAYLYGGDFKEKYHNGHFCLDGLIRSNGEPSPAWFEYQKVIEDIRVDRFENETGRLCVRNRMEFTSTDKVTCVVTSYLGESVVETKQFQLPVIEPHGEGMIELNSILATLNENQPANLRIELQFEQEEEILGENRVRILGRYGIQQPAETESGDMKVTVSESRKSIEAIETSSCYEITTGTSQITISKVSASIIKYMAAGALVMERGPELNLFRPYTDNDVKMEKQWKDLHLDTCGMIVYRSECSILGEKAVLCFEGNFAPNGMNWGIQTSITYVIDAEGTVEMKIHGTFMKAPDIHFPKLGTQLILPESFGKVTYCGLGPMENYSDRECAAQKGIYQAMADAMDRSYDYPQEYGNRGKVEWAQFYSSSDQVGIAFASDRELDFSVRPYSDAQIYEATHAFELEKEHRLYVNLDYKNSGLGSGSCGPERLEQYQVYPLPFAYSIFMKPYVGETMGYQIARQLGKEGASHV